MSSIRLWAGLVSAVTLLNALQAVRAGAGPLLAPAAIGAVCVLLVCWRVAAVRVTRLIVTVAVWLLAVGALTSSVLTASAGAASEALLLGIVAALSGVLGVRAVATWGRQRRRLSHDYYVT